MREFTTAVRDAHEQEEVNRPYEMKLDGRVLTYYFPTEGQLMIYMADNGRHASITDSVAATVNFFVELFDEDSREYLVARILDRQDPFGVQQIEEILAGIVEDYTSRPTKPSYDSSLSPMSGGTNSTPPTTPSTSSGNPFVVSSGWSTPGASRT